MFTHSSFHLSGRRKQGQHAVERRGPARIYSAAGLHQGGRWLGRGEHPAGPPSHGLRRQTDRRAGPQTDNCTVYDIDAPSVNNADKSNKLTSSNLTGVQHVY